MRDKERKGEERDTRVEGASEGERRGGRKREREGPVCLIPLSEEERRRECAPVQQDL